MRDDAADGFYWKSVRAYDPTIGRFISHDPLGRVPVFFASQPYAYAGNNPVSNVDPSGQRYTNGSSGGSSNSNSGASPKTRIHQQGNGQPKPRSGTEADRCVGAIKCVIFIDGVDPWPIKPRGGDYDEYSWNGWTHGFEQKKIKAAYYVAGDGAEGMNWLHRVLMGLVQDAFDGTVTVVGHSNGAAALFLYFAMAEQGHYSGDFPIARFVAFDAPAGSGIGENAITAIWSHWNPWFTVFTADKYIRAHHIHGLYAWEWFDPLSGDIMGEGAVQEQVFHDLSLSRDPHTYLEFYPNSWLLNGL